MCGSASLAIQVIERGLADELLLAVYPLLLGHGLRCFPETGSGGVNAFELVASTTTPTGVLLNRYRRAAAASAA